MSHVLAVVVFGLPGSGKSYFASRLAGELDAEYLSSDLTRKDLFEKRTYSTSETEAVYRHMEEAMKRALSAGKSVVLDGTFNRADARRSFTAAAKPYADLHFIEVRADRALIERRLSKPRLHSEADLAVHDDIRLRFEPMENPDLVLESTDENIAEMLDTALHYLKGKS